jgi:alanine dehydrogenase
MTLIIDNPTVEEILEPAAVIDALEDGHRELAAGRAVNAQPYRVLTPRRAADYGVAGDVDPAHHALTSLSGAISKLDVACDRVDSDIIGYQTTAEGVRRVRIPASPDRRFCGLVYVYSSRTGEPLAIIHDGYLQKFRVAGTGAVGTRHLAREDAKVLALIGTGWQAEAAVLCQPAVRALERIKVFSPSPGRKEAFAERWTVEAGVDIVPVDSARDAVAGADIVYTATNSPKAVVLADWLEPGQFVTGVTDLEVELDGWERCDVLAANRHGLRWERYAIGGSEVIPEQGREYLRQETTIDWEALPLLGAIALGSHPGRTSADQITGLLLRGDGVQFAAIGAYLYQACRERGLGTEIPTELFLQDEQYIP